MTTQTAAIACKLCRLKKQKCDRTRPVCTQCAKAPEGCSYLEQHRRGLPAGYVNSIEKRLAETERALYFALAELHGGIVEHGEYDDTAGDRVKPAPHRSKAEAVESWGRWPLTSRSAAQAWFLWQRPPRGVVLSSQAVATGHKSTADQLPRHPLVTTDEEGITSSSRRRGASEAYSVATTAPILEHRASERRGQTNHLDRNDKLVSSGPGTAQGRLSSRAGLVAEQNKSIYF